MRRLARTIGQALRSLSAHRFRSVLAGLGVAVGIAAVMLTTGIGQGAGSSLMTALGTTGTRLLVVRPNQLKKSPARRQVQGYSSSLKLEDYAAVAALPRLTACAPVVEGATKIATEQGTVATQVLGTTAAFFAVRHFEVASGRLFDEGENFAAMRLAVLGGRIARSLFPTTSAVGREIRIGRATFEVVGTLDAKGAAADGADADNQVFVPVRTAMRRLLDSRQLSAIFLSARSSEDLAAVEVSIRELLRERHALERLDKPDDFTIQKQERFLAAQKKLTSPLQLFTTALAILALLIGGVGVLALMFLSVQERRPEIGLRVAVGATPTDILLQFLSESLLLALGGGSAGVAIGAIAIRVAARLTHWPIRISLEALVTALATAVVVGVVFGALPALKAARMLPVEALRTE